MRMIKKIKLKKSLVTFLGAPVTAPPVILMESGSKILMEDGSSKIKLE